MEEKKKKSKGPRPSLFKEPLPFPDSESSDRDSFGIPKSRFSAEKEIRFLLSSGLFFFFLTFLVFFPIFSHPFSRIPTDYVAKSGLPEVDQAVFLHALWWVGDAVWERHINPFFCPLLGQPNGLSLIYTTICPFLGTVSYPLVKIFGLIFTYNVWIFLSFFLLPILTQILVLELGGRKEGAFLAGFLMFFPFFLQAQISHLNILSAYWFPLCYWLYLRFLRKNTWKSALLAGLSMGAVFYVCSYQTVHLLILFSADLVLRGVQHLRFKIGVNQKKILQSIFAALLFIVLILPFFLTKFLDIRHQGMDVSIGIGAKVFWSAEIKDYLFFKAGEFAIFPGYVWWALAFVIFFLRRGKMSSFNIFFFSFVFFILSLGPVFKWNGPVKFDALPDGYLFMPGMLFHRLPFLEGYRVFVRMGFVYIFLLTVWMGCNFDFFLFHRWMQKKYAVLFLAGFCCFIFAEKFDFFKKEFFPFHVLKVKVPQFYYRLGEQKNDVTYYEFPAKNWTFLLPQTIHHKKLVNYYTSRDDADQKKQIAANHFLSLMAKCEENQDINWSNLLLKNSDYEETFKKMKVQGIVLHLNFISPENRIFLEKWLEETLKLHQVFKGDGIMVFEIQ
jgi:hypothetical protein